MKGLIQIYCFFEDLRTAVLCACRTKAP